MPRVPRQPHTFSAWAFLILVVIALAMFGFDRVFPWFLFAGYIGFIVIYPAYLGLGWFWSRPASAHLENGHLVLRRRTGQVAGEVNLAAPFDAECVHHGDKWAYYRVKQGGHTMKFTVPLSADGALVRDGLQLPWPPPAEVRWWP